MQILCAQVIAQAESQSQNLGTQDSTSTLLNPPPIHQNELPYEAGVGPEYRLRSKEWPPGAWIGYGLDMTQVMPLDIQTIRDRVIVAVQLVTPTGKKEPKNLPGGGRWNGPSDVTLTFDESSGGSRFCWGDHSVAIVTYNIQFILTIT